jgi:hypothetical protein
VGPERLVLRDRRRRTAAAVRPLGVPSEIEALADFGSGLEINERWLRPGVTREEIAEGLRPLLELPVEHVLATHGGQTDRAALERALSSS